MGMEIELKNIIDNTEYWKDENGKIYTCEVD